MIRWKQVESTLNYLNGAKMHIKPNHLLHKARGKLKDAAIGILKVAK